MRFRLLVLGVMLGAACWPTGPNTASGLTSCEQLRECACDPAISPNPVACNQAVDNLEAMSNGLQLCTNSLGVCGQPLTVTPQF